MMNGSFGKLVWGSRIEGTKQNQQVGHPFVWYGNWLGHSLARKASNILCQSSCICFLWFPAPRSLISAIGFWKAKLGRGVIGLDNECIWAEPMIHEKGRFSFASTVSRLLTSRLDFGVLCKRVTLFSTESTQRSPHHPSREIRNLLSVNSCLFCHGPMPHGEAKSTSRILFSAID